VDVGLFYLIDVVKGKEISIFGFPYYIIFMENSWILLSVVFINVI
jgi:hypothetical protein